MAGRSGIALSPLVPSAGPAAEKLSRCAGSSPVPDCGSRRRMDGSSFRSGTGQPLFHTAHPLCTALRAIPNQPDCGISLLIRERKMD